MHISLPLAEGPAEQKTRKRGPRGRMGKGQSYGGPADGGDRFTVTFPVGAQNCPDRFALCLVPIACTGCLIPSTWYAIMERLRENDD